MHFPLTLAPDPAQKNLRQMASIYVMAHCDKLSAIMEYMGTARSTDLIHTRRPLLAISEPWHSCIFLDIASIIECISALGGLLCAQR